MPVRSRKPFVFIGATRAVRPCLRRKFVAPGTGSKVRFARRKLRSCDGVQKAVKPGEYFLDDAAGPILANAGRRTARVLVKNTGDRPIQVGSHYHFFEANR